MVGGNIVAYIDDQLVHTTCYSIQCTQVHRSDTVAISCVASIMKQLDAKREQAIKKGQDPTMIGPPSTVEFPDEGLKITCITNSNGIQFDVFDKWTLKE